MDPLSIAAGVVSLLQITSNIISICYDFKAALKDTPWALTAILEQLKSLRGIVEHLEGLIDGKATALRRAQGLELLLHPDSNALTVCLQELRVLESVIGTPETVTGSKWGAAIQALRWKLKDNETQECLARIERCKTTLSLALAGDQVALLAKVQDQIASLEITAQRVDSMINEMVLQSHLNSKDEEQLAVMRWISTVDPHEKHESTVAAQQAGTSQWILENQIFQSWHEHNGQCLWLSGLPGAGKTVLFSQIVRYVMQRYSDPFKNTSDTGVAYFYCDFNQPDHQRSLSIIGSLVGQLCAQLFVPEMLRDAYRKSFIPTQRRRPTLELLQQTIISLSKKHRVIILIDALDECQDRDKMLDFFCRLQSADSGSPSMLVTSRMESDISDMFRDFSRLNLTKCRSQMENDIQAYVNYRLASETNFKKLPSSFRAELQSALDEKCHGMFRWAQCQLDMLSKQRTLRAIRMSLNQLPEGLNETYARILLSTAKGDIELLRRILMWVAFAVLPLTVRELSDAVAIEVATVSGTEVEENRLTDPEQVVQLGGSLLSVSEHGVIRLAHLSVKDYLLSNDIKALPEISMFALDSGLACREMAFNCLTYLSLDTFADGPAKTSQSWEDRLLNLPLGRHAAKCWGYYFRAANLTCELTSKAKWFLSPTLQPTFFSWVQLLNSTWVFNYDQYPKFATPLYYAASFGLGCLVDHLIKSGVDINAPGSRFGGTALHGATLRKHVRIMEALLQAGADPCKVDFNQIAPLHTAARISDPTIINLLLDAGASVATKDMLGKTPLDWAVESRQELSVKLLKGEVFSVLDGPRGLEEVTMYRRPSASFQALAVAQGLAAASNVYEARIKP